MPTIELPLHSRRTGERDFAVVQAEIVPDLAPHLASLLTFAVHENPEFGMIGWFRVLCVETGSCISAADAPTKAVTLKNARKYLAEKTMEEAERCWQKQKPNAELTGRQRLHGAAGNEQE